MRAFCSVFESGAWEASWCESIQYRLASWGLPIERR